MIISLPKHEKDSIARACAVAGVNVDFFEDKTSEIMHVMITQDGEGISAKTAWRVSALVCSYEETRTWEAGKQ